MILLYIFLTGLFILPLILLSVPDTCNVKVIFSVIFWPFVILMAYGILVILCLSELSKAKK